jgi:hypothetical protein
MIVAYEERVVFYHLTLWPIVQQYISVVLKVNDVRKKRSDYLFDFDELCVALSRVAYGELALQH